MKIFLGNLLIGLVIIVVILLFGLYVFRGASVFTYFGTDVPTAKDRGEILRTFIETAAIIVAGYWTYTRFIRGREETREDHPYITIQHKIEDFDLEHELVYLNLSVFVKNEGKRKLDLTNSNIYIRQVKPFPQNCLDRLIELREDNRDDEILEGKDYSAEEDENDKYLFLDYGQRLNLYRLGSRNGENLRTSMRKLEPNQIRQLQFAFPIPGDVEIIEVISYFDFEKGRKIFKKCKTKISRWEFASVYQLKSRTKSGLL